MGEPIPETIHTVSTVLFVIPESQCGLEELIRHFNLYQTCNKSGNSQFQVRWFQVQVQVCYEQAKSKSISLSYL